MDRRDFLRAAGLAGFGALGLGSAALGQGGQKPQAGEGEVRITDVKTHDIGRIIVEIVTDAGVSGWGEVNTVPSRLAAPVVRAYRPLLVGANPTRIEHIWQMLYRAHRNVRGGAVHVSAIGGIDIALWDILGKLAKMPIYRLLGGPCRARMTRYPSKKAWKQTTHRLHPMVERPARLDGIVTALEKDRERLGRRGYLMLDGHGKFTAQVAIQLATRIEDLNLLYFEEVVPPENNADLAKVKRHTSVPLAVGERMSTVWSFRPVFEGQLADVVNPDVVSVGGVSQLRKVAAYAEVYDVPIAPHSTHSEIGLSASLHVGAAVNNFLIQEAYGPRKGSVAAGLDWSNDGHFPLPPGPGLGVKIDRDALEAAVARRREKGDSGIGKAYFTDDGAVADR